MLMRSQDVLFSTDFSIRVLLTLEGLMVVLNMIYPPWHSMIENKLKTFMAGLLDFNKKLYSLEKFSLLPDLYSST